MTVGGGEGCLWRAARLPDNQLTSLGLQNLQTTILFVWLHVFQQLIIPPSTSLVMIILGFFILSLLLRIPYNFSTPACWSTRWVQCLRSSMCFGTREAKFSPCPCGTCAGLPGRKSTCVHKEGRKPILQGPDNNTTTVKTIKWLTQPLLNSVLKLNRFEFMQQIHSRLWIKTKVSEG